MTAELNSSASSPPAGKTSSSPDTERLLRLNQIGLALSSERDIERLLSLILTSARELTGADAGSLYIVEKSMGKCGKAEDTLFFRLSQNDSTVLQPQQSFPVSRSSLAGYSALSGHSIRCDDAYQLPPQVPYSFSAAWDEENNYCTRSVLVVPMKNHSGQVIGVLQLINRKRRNVPLRNAGDVAREVIPFDDELAHLAAVLASQAAVALENNLLLGEVTRLLEEIEVTLDSFVRASASLIDNRDPATAGHSERVTRLTIALARAASEASEGPFQQVHFSQRELQELVYAGLLHDVGKIGVRDYIFAKSHKLEAGHFTDVLNRIELRSRSRELDCARAQMKAMLELDSVAAQARCEELQHELDAELMALKADRELMRRANDPWVSFLPESEFALQQDAIRRLACLSYQTPDGHVYPLLRPDEVAALSVHRGSLTDAERRQMEDHAEMSFEFLRRIRWNKDFERIPDIAHCHHEKLNGTGYPRGVQGDEIALQTRMLTVADIFDALTAADRLYKPALPVEGALEILREEARRGELDTDVVELFISRGLFHMPPKTDVG